MVRLNLALLGMTGLLAASASAAVSQITRQGRYLFDASGNRFFVKGLAYQQPGTVGNNTAQNAANGGFPEPSDYVDPLADITACNRDIPNFTKLGINTIRVYSLNPSADHSACMNALNNANIYVIADLSLPLNGSINRASPSWDVGLLNAYIATIDNLRGFSNLLAFNVGNEVINGVTNTDAAPFVKAAARDVKAYLKSKSSNALVSYASTDGDNGATNWRDSLASYLTCGSEATSIDLYGLNVYRWCGASSYTASGYNTLTSDFQNFQIPVYFSEFGCITSPPRLWTEVQALYTNPMAQVWSGGVAFQYFNDTLGYGLTTLANGQITTNADFDRLATQFTTVAPPTTGASTADSTYPACAAANANFLASNTLPPTPNQAACSCVVNSALPCVTKPGLTPVVVGDLLNYGCSQLGSSSTFSCLPIASNGTTGVYGPVSFCSADEKLSYVLTQYYESQNMNAQACDFAGNATINSNAPKVAASIQPAVTSCLAAIASGGVSTPTAQGSAAPVTSSVSPSGASFPGSSSPSSKNGGASLMSVGWAQVGLIGAISMGMALFGGALVAA